MTKPLQKYYKAPYVPGTEVMGDEVGDLFSITDGIIVHGCNCQGVMGSGVALSIKNKWPKVHQRYKDLQEEFGLFLGDIQVITSSFDVGLSDKYNAWSSEGTLPPGLIVVNAMTQYGYGVTGERFVDYDAISACFSRIRMVARDTRKKVYFPLIGCGLGGGDWSEVAPRISMALGKGVEHSLIRLAKPARALRVVKLKDAKNEADRKIEIA